MSDKPDSDKKSKNTAIELLEYVVSGLPEPVRPYARDLVLALVASTAVSLLLLPVMTAAGLAVRERIIVACVIYALSLTAAIYFGLKRRARLATDAKNAVVRIISPQAVNVAGIQAAFKVWGCKWPATTTIVWPKSADALFTAIENALEKTDQFPPFDADFAYLAQNASDNLQTAREKRQRAVSRLIAMIAKLEKMNMSERVDTVSAFLLVANLEVHSGLSFLCSSADLSKLQIEPPLAWKSWQTITDGYRQRIFARLFAQPGDGDLVRGRITAIGDHGPSSLWVTAPEGVFTRAKPWPRDLRTWLIPQLEYYHEADALPPAYLDQYWSFERPRKWPEASGGPA